MNVLFIAPGYPAEMPFFVQGLAEVGATVFGLGDGPEGFLPERARQALSGYLQLRSLWDEDAVLEALRQWEPGVAIDRVECLWEPGMLLAARIREAFGLPGMTVEQTLPFRDKERMKQLLDEAGVRTPRHARARDEDEVRRAAERIGYPLILKPIAGAGSADTHRVEDEAGLEEVLPKIRHVAEVSVEEYVDGEEYTFDTICHDGEVAYYNIAWYRPKPLIARTVQWISPQTVTLRDLDEKHLEAGRDMGLKVLAALGFRTGFTHMEWFYTPEGEAVFGEIGARPPGARSVELMNYGCDLDVFRGWAEAVCHGTFSQKVERRYNAIIVFKRAMGEGRIQRIDGLEPLLAQFGHHVVCVDLLPVGSHRRDWKQTLISDGYLILRHPHLPTALAMADRVGTHLQLVAEL